jgi:hypothetical protein
VFYCDKYFINAAKKASVFSGVFFSILTDKSLKLDIVTETPPIVISLPGGKTMYAKVPGVAVMPPIKISPGVSSHSQGRFLHSEQGEGLSGSSPAPGLRVKHHGQRSSPE